MNSFPSKVASARLQRKEGAGSKKGRAATTTTTREATWDKEAERDNNHTVVRGREAGGGRKERPTGARNSTPHAAMEVEDRTADKQDGKGPESRRTPETQCEKSATSRVEQSRAPVAYKRRELYLLTFDRRPV
ncbi:hypothetical protein AXG93_3217s1050 [Marchantia polymorpha subsp. ruderalis]|uniref:Uncharacterized protein n=1 Tax=Marchantia polymorpha subsp. ruderalis TaxID=1480154 RepID=A0A176VWA6_MARPO|nr:hypothetical protein AXG93_3217s1050 [Marchantia polymorpha subsp. ruderalis]